MVKLLRRNAAMYERNLGAPLELAGVADRSLKPDSRARTDRETDHARCRRAGRRAPTSILSSSCSADIEPARALILKALAAGKDVVTANKALLAEHGERDFRARRQGGLAIGFEASVGGGVPIIRTLREALAGDRQRAVYGIVNGTCNSILTTMTESGAEFADALADAQRKGLAEADPATRHRGPRRGAQTLPAGDAGVRRAAEAARRFTPKASRESRRPISTTRASSATRSSCSRSPRTTTARSRRACIPR